MTIGGPTLITVFESTAASSETDDLVECLRLRLAGILEANPWIVGRLQTRSSGGGTDLVVPALPTPQDAEFAASALLRVVDDETPHAAGTASGGGFALTREDLYAQKGADIVNTDHLVTRLTVVRRNSGSGVAAAGGGRCRLTVVLSMCHAVADAQTIYQVWGMFDDHAPVVALKVDRVDVRTKGQFSLLGGAAAAKLWWLIVSARQGFVQRTVLRRRWRLADPRVEVRSIDLAWIAARKARHVATLDAPYVSSSDLLTSWFLGATDCDGGGLAINFRGKVAGLDDDTLAGNYGSMMVFSRDEFADPACIRRSVLSLGAVETGHGLPGPGRRCGVVTGWHGFYQTVAVGPSSRWRTFRAFSSHRPTLIARPALTPTRRR